MELKTEQTLPIKGLQKTSLIDYPPYTSAVVFIGGCNFRCPYCHNFDLVLRPDETPNMDEAKIIDFLVDRKDWVDAVVMTGGEPTLYPDLKRFIKRLKGMNLMVKLDTNGTNPELVWDLLEEKLVDYIAMDIKAPLNQYDNVVMMPFDVKKIKKSIALIMNSGIDHEFRTTVMPKLHTRESLLQLVRPIEGAKKYVIQQFRKEMGVIDEGFFKGIEPFSKTELENMKKVVEPYFAVVEIRE